MKDAPLVFALRETQALGHAIAARLGCEPAPLEERDFEDGEHKIRPLANVRGRDVYVIQSLHGEADSSPNDKLVRLLMFIGALKDAAAARVTAVVPYLAYARKDQKSKPLDPVSTRYVAGFFESVRCDAVVAIDVHNVAAFQNAFRCCTEHLEAASLLAARCVPLVGASPAVVVSPDEGGIKRADRFRHRLAALLGRPVGAAFAEKYRSAGLLRGNVLVGDVRGQVAVIVDDLVAAGNTLDRAARACAADGATRVVAAVTHAVFTAEADEVLGNSPIDAIVVTDTIPPGRLRHAGLASRVEVVATAPLFGEAIARMHAGGSVVELNG
ncbi:MAG TPA: ribose-phosphate diphosphokinase [Usitatibacter sp.]|nr:ribose-phosphate diphosphokinase [Usitatibacter sp.]